MTMLEILLKRRGIINRRIDEEISKLQDERDVIDDCVCGGGEEDECDETFWTIAWGIEDAYVETRCVRCGGLVEV